MTMRFLLNQSITQTGHNGSLQNLYEFLNFMRTPSPAGPGWTIPRSSNGSVGGAGDNITQWSDLSQFVSGVSESWFVLRDPAGKREIMWHRVDTTDSKWYWSNSKSAHFTGGDAGNQPTATDSKTMHTNFPEIGTVTGSATTLHVGADDAAPYGWWMYSNNAGNFGTYAMGYAMFPMDALEAEGDDDPVVFYQCMYYGNFIQSALTREAGDQHRCTGYIPGTDSFQNIPACFISSEGSNAFAPNRCVIDADGKDLSFPVLFGRRGSLGTGGFKGVSTFVQWNGTTRSAGETFASLTRISIGDINVPWDGVTTPVG